MLVVNVEEFLNVSDSLAQPTVVILPTSGDKSHLDNIHTFCPIFLVSVAKLTRFYDENHQNNLFAQIKLVVVQNLNVRQSWPQSKAWYPGPSLSNCSGRRRISLCSSFC